MSRTSAGIFGRAAWKHTYKEHTSNCIQVQLGHEMSGMDALLAELTSYPTENTAQLSRKDKEKFIAKHIEIIKERTRDLSVPFGHGELLLV
jgi:hypothetical protein